MRHGSLFSGIGGFDLAAEWCGWENIFQVEIDKFCQKVLEKNFPKVQRYGDIKEFTGTKYRGTIDVLSGGFPCQPVSSAGLRKGKNDDRWYWPEMHRVASEILPPFIVAENVDGLIDQSEGLVFEEVQKSLEDIGYEVQAYVLPASGVQGSHRRYRVWIIANHTEKFVQKYEVVKTPRAASKFGVTSRGQTCNIWAPSRETNFSELAGELHGVSNRMDRIAALGNSIVPQIAYEIFKAIEQTFNLSSGGRIDG